MKLSCGESRHRRPTPGRLLELQKCDIDDFLPIGLVPACELARPVLILVAGDIMNSLCAELRIGLVIGTQGLLKFG